MCRKIMIVILFVMISVSFGSAGPQEDADNMLGHAYQLVIDGRADEAKTSFSSAMELSLTNGLDRPALEGLKGLYVLGDSASAFRYAEQLLQKTSDWSTACGIGYFYASVKGKDGQACDAFVRSYKLASNRGDWYGMAETAKGLYRIGKKEDALGYLETAEKVSTMRKGYKNMVILAEAYRLMGYEDRALAVEKNMKVLGPSAAPQAQVIDTTPGDDKASPEAQMQKRRMVEQNVQSDEEYIAAEEIRKQEEKYYNEWHINFHFFSYLLFDSSSSMGYGSLVPDVVISGPVVIEWAKGNRRCYSVSPSGSYFYVNVK
jgi:hypothetical protein